MGVKENVLEADNELQKLMILLAGANNEPIRGRLKLQKMMFLLSDKVEHVKEQCSYDADIYGPYSEIVEDGRNYLQDIGVFFADQNEIELTDEGIQILNVLSSKIDEEMLQLLNEYKGFLNDMTSNELLSYVYSAHPSMAYESVKYENLKPHMEEHLLALVKKNKISSQRMAELVHKPHDYVVKKMKEKKIMVLSS